MAEKIVQKIEKEIYPDISTFELYQIVRDLLEKEKKEVSMKFNLKQAMKRLGPEGFVFEKFIREILEKLGYKAINNQMLRGACIEHEIDFIAENKKKKYIGECKFRNRIGERVDVNVPMKMFAMMDDLIAGKIGPKGKLKPIIVTNEKFTEKSIKYAKCKKIDLLGWSYPMGKSLENIIDEHSFYPLTVLPSFSDSHLKIFSEEGILLLEDLKKADYSLFRKHISLKHFNQLKKEASLIV